MILVIRISGMIGLTKEMQESLHRIRLRRKYSATLLEETSFNRKLLKKIRNFIAYGDIEDQEIKKLIAKRGEAKENKKIVVEDSLEQIKKSGFLKSNLKPFFRLHPPRGGIETKKHFGVGKGVLGDHKSKIKLLLEKML
ncbi:TPA: hypothetical protein EYQ19_00665 [Candidatus Pacearchaeota archaeon]|jgi:large subunit ribosomal protein L30|nr:hypothetical protein [Candidatus Pacearchaeota archaeon]